eukprot:1192785-Prorocentrum_minimum.AAC.5
MSRKRAPPRECSTDQVLDDWSSRGYILNRHAPIGGAYLRLRVHVGDLDDDVAHEEAKGGVEGIPLADVEVCQRDGACAVRYRLRQKVVRKPPRQLRRGCKGYNSGLIRHAAVPAVAIDASGIIVYNSLCA